MGYEDFFKTLDELLATIDDTVGNKADMDNAGTAGPGSSYMFDKYNGALKGLEVFMEKEIQE